MYDRPKKEISGMLILGSTVKRQGRKTRKWFHFTLLWPGSGPVLGSTLLEAFDCLGGVQKEQLRQENMTHKKWLEDEEKEPKEEKTECASTGCSRISGGLECRGRKILYLVALKGKTKTNKGIYFSSVYTGKIFQKNPTTGIEMSWCKRGNFPSLRNLGSFLK